MTVCYCFSSSSKDIPSQWLTANFQLSSGGSLTKLCTAGTIEQKNYSAQTVISLIIRVLSVYKFWSSWIKLCRRQIKHSWSNQPPCQHSPLLCCKSVQRKNNEIQLGTFLIHPFFFLFNNHCLFSGFGRREVHNSAVLQQRRQG